MATAAAAAAAFVLPCSCGPRAVARSGAAEGTKPGGGKGTGARSLSTAGKNPALDGRTNRGSLLGGAWRHAHSLASPFTSGRRLASSCEEFGRSRGTPQTRQGARTLIFAGKGFGEIQKKTAKAKSKSPSDPTKSDAQGVCHCGGGEDRLPYTSCCARFHGGVVEPDALSLLKARYCAFSKGVIPYLIRTTHPENPDITRPGGKATLEDDCKATSSRLVFKNLEVKNVENGTSSDEAFISFRVTYAYKDGPDRSDKYLVEKSRFVKLESRWLYREKIDVDLVSSMEWNTPGFTLSESPEPGSKTYANPWANSKLRLRK